MPIPDPVRPRTADPGPLYRNLLLGRREDGAKPLGKAAALAEAKRWLRDLPRDQALKRMSQLSNGVARAKGRLTLPLLPAAPKDAPGIGEDRPYAHPRYWAAFILLGAPE
jgi:CHAT domain-containing protein